MEECPYNGVLSKINRLGLTILVDEVRNLITKFDLRVEEKRDANGAAAVTEKIDKRFSESGGWTQGRHGTAEIDWRKCVTASDSTKVCIGVELQISGRSTSFVTDIEHLRRDFGNGEIDIGIIVTTTDKLGNYLTDRAANLREAKRFIDATRAFTEAILLIAIEHDGAGSALPKHSKSPTKKPKAQTSGQI